MSTNVIPFPAPLTFNGLFVDAFMDEQTPCAALGLVEEAGQEKGFVAISINEKLPIQVTESGFDFGVEALGTDRYQILHFILNFKNLKTYDVLLNPNNEVVRKVIEVMRETRQYFFFAFKDGQMTAFHQSLADDDWFFEYGDIIYASKTSSEDYETGLKQAKTCEGFLHGECLDWVCRDNIEFLDLKEHRFEARRG